jgi:cytochrome P450/NADPH-cytochrome P450 reductase
MIYKDELESHVESGTLTTFRPAFSRKLGVPKTYVQDAIRADSALLKNLLVDQNGYFFVCGSAKGMGSSVRNAIVDMANEWKVDGASGSEFVDELMKRGHYVEDTWG